MRKISTTITSKIQHFSELKGRFKESEKERIKISTKPKKTVYIYAKGARSTTVSTKSSARYEISKIFYQIQ